VRPQSEVKQIVWRAFSFVGDQLMTGTYVDHHACKKRAAFAWVHSSGRPKNSIWFPTTLQTSFDDNGYYKISVCHWTIEVKESFMAQMFIHEYIHYSGPMDQPGRTKELPQAVQPANAANYHEFARDVVLEKTQEEMQRR